MTLIEYAEVCLNIPIIDKDTFTYQVDEPVQVGMRVLVDFRSKKEEGVVLKKHGNEPTYQTKKILKIIDAFPIITQQQIDLAYWMKDFYICSLGECLHKMFPSGKRLKKKQKEKIISPVRNLHPLNQEQQSVYKEIHNCFGSYQIHLLFGITGSGKTEVYIHLIYFILNQTDKSILLLVPEIGLTFHTIQKLNEVFPNEVTLLNSSMKVLDKFYSYVKILENEKRILIGTRSAIFAPFKKLGLVIMDEEHDSSYKENSSPRYHTRQIAMKICKEQKATLLLGSATPSLEVFYHSKKKKIKIHILKKRAVQGSQLAKIRIFEKSHSQMSSPIGSKLAFKIKETLERKQQVILFLNRRGYSPLLYEPEKKEYIQCPKCTFNLCYHKLKKAKCHLCGYEIPFAMLNEQYNRNLELLGFGTQKIEEYLLNEYKGAIVERLDQDAIKNRNLINQILSRLYKGEIDILVGTQMISKGLDSSKVSLVGVLNANIGLGLPDFRSNEKVFSLLTQVSGRAGRGQIESEVIIETNDKENPIIQLAVYQDYEKFFRYEIPYRRSLNLPPFSRLIRFVTRTKDEILSEKAIQEVYQSLILCNENSDDFLGPAPCPFYKIDQNYRNHFIIKTNKIQEWKQKIKNSILNLKLSSKVYLEIDFDPMELL